MACCRQLILGSAALRRARQLRLIGLFFGESVDKNNLLNKVRKFNNYLTEINSFTSVQTIVEATTALLENDQSGVFNVANKGYTSLWNLCMSGVSKW